MTQRRKQGFAFMLLRALQRWWKHPLTLPVSEKRVLYADILRQAAQTQSLGDLLHRFPERLSEALDLASFHVFILDQDEQTRPAYRLFTTTLPAMVFPSSSATVARMKRERRPSLFVPSGTSRQDPQAWQMLATQEEIDILLAIGTQLLFPLEGRTGLIGFASLSREAQRPFSSAELRFLRDLGPQMGQGVETALLIRRLNQQAIERERTDRKLAVAKEVQEHLLPKHLPSVQGLELAAFYKSAEQVGGDYYDAFITSEGALLFVIADVSGKGVAAALVMAALRASLHALAMRPEMSLTRILTDLNELLFASSSMNRYATLFLGLYYAGTGTLEYCNAGHNAPFLVRADRTIERLTAGGTVIGLFAEANFTTQRISFQAGNTLVAYTDGITEATNGVGVEWSEDQLGLALSQGGAMDATSLIKYVRETVDTFVGSTPQADDMTLLVLTRSER